MSVHEDQVQGFARYNSGFNRRLFEQLARLPDEDRKRDMGAFFGSIHNTLNHILLADRIWLGRLKAALPAMPSLERASVVHEFSSLGQQLCADFDELHIERRATDDVISAWAEEMSDDLFAGTMRYRNASGVSREHPIWIAVAHMFNHQTHHRGQVTTLMYQLGHDPGVTDYLVYVQ